MRRVRSILHASLLCRALASVCRWVGAQWRQSGIVQAFLRESDTGRAAGEASVFYRLLKRLHALLSWLYEKLKLERVLGGSIFRKLWFWCVLPAVLAPLAPTMAVAALEGVAVCALILRFARRREQKLVYAPTNKYVLLFCLAYAVGTVTSVDPVSSRNVGMLTIFFTLFTLVILNGIGDRRGVVRAAKLLVLAGAAVSLYGFYQYLFRSGYQSSAWVDDNMFSAISFRVPSTMGNPNMLGQYLVLMLPLGLTCLLTERGTWRRLLWLACCGTMGLCLVLTFSRGAWLALLLAGAVYFIMLQPRLLLLAPAALAGLYFVMPATVIQRFTSIGDLADRSTSYRVSIWRGSLRMLKDHWLHGIGPGSTAFNMIYPAYSYDEIVAPHTHNLFLQFIADAGVTALVLFLLLLIAYFRRLCAAIHRTADRAGRLFQIAFVSGVLGFMVQAMTDYSFYNYRVMFLFWAYLGLGMAAARWNELPEVREDD